MASIIEVRDAKDNFVVINIKSYFVPCFSPLPTSQAGIKPLPAMPVEVIIPKGFLGDCPSASFIALY